MIDFLKNHVSANYQYPSPSFLFPPSSASLPLLHLWQQPCCQQQLRCHPLCPRRKAMARELLVICSNVIFQKIGQNGRPRGREPPRSTSFDETNRMVTCFENPRRKRKNKKNAKFGCAWGRGWPHAPPTRPAGRPRPRAHPNSAFFGFLLFLESGKSRKKPRILKTRIMNTSIPRHEAK